MKIEYNMKKELVHDKRITEKLRLIKETRQNNIDHKAYIMVFLKTLKRNHYYSINPQVIKLHFPIININLIYLFYAQKPLFPANSSWCNNPYFIFYQIYPDIAF